MKKTYSTPSLTVNGDAVNQTLSGVRLGNELAQPLVKFNMTSG